VDYQDPVVHPHEADWCLRLAIERGDLGMVCLLVGAGEASGSHWQCSWKALDKVDRCMHDLGWHGRWVRAAVLGGWVGGWVAACLACKHCRPGLTLLPSLFPSAAHVACPSAAQVPTCCPPCLPFLPRRFPLLHDARVPADYQETPLTLALASGHFDIAAVSVGSRVLAGGVGHWASS